MQIRRVFHAKQDSRTGYAAALFAPPDQIVAERGLIAHLERLAAESQTIGVPSPAPVNNNPLLSI